MTFETQSDKDRESIAVFTFVNYMKTKYNPFIGCSCVKLGKYELDFIIQLHSGKRITIEVKGVKSYNLEDNHIPIISVLKIAKMQRSVNENGFNASYLIFAYKDGIKVQRLINLKGSFSWSGRKQRKGSANDRELILRLDRTTFDKIPFSTLKNA